MDKKIETNKEKVTGMVSLKLLSHSEDHSRFMFLCDSILSEFDYVIDYLKNNKKINELLLFNGNPNLFKKGDYQLKKEIKIFDGDNDQEWLPIHVDINSEDIV